MAHHNPWDRMDSFESLDYDEAEHTFIEAKHELSERERTGVKWRLIALNLSLMLMLGVLVGSSALTMRPRPPPRKNQQSP